MTCTPEELARLFPDMPHLASARWPWTSTENALLTDRRTLERYRGALEKIADTKYGIGRKIAREALKEN